MGVLVGFSFFSFLWLVLVECRQINEVVHSCSLEWAVPFFWGKSVFLSFLTSYLNLDCLLSAYVHTLLMSVVV